jgi:soluble lytic murein transglycosylase-like protein
VRVFRRSSTVVALLALALAGSAAYTVKPGDNLTSIAARFGVTVSDLARANSLADPNRLSVGRTLDIPTSSGLPAALRTSPARVALVPAFKRWAAANQLPADLVMAVAWVESGWQNNVVSSTGAIGIGQLMPRTTEFIRTDLIGQPHLDPTVPEHNIRMSARYLRWLLQRNDGDVVLAVASYYQGPRSLELTGMRPSTYAYVRAVLALRGRFASA